MKTVRWGMIGCGDVTVASGATLTIGPGVIVKFLNCASTASRLIISGGLVANGTAAQKIYDEIDLFGHAKRLSPTFQKHIKSFADHPLVGEAMGIGMFGALEVVKDKKTKEAFDLATVGAGLKVYNQAVARGLFIRNMGDRIAICPPLIINETELADLFGRLRQSFDASLADLKSEGHFKG